MREVQIVIRDDLDGTPDAQTVTFAYQGTGYEIDLGPDHLAEFDQLLAPYIKVARPSQEPVKPVPRKKASQPNSIERARAKIENGEPIPQYLQRTADRIRVRDWANDHGWSLPETTGRMPDAVHEAYNHAHPDNPIPVPARPRSKGAK